MLETIEHGQQEISYHVSRKTSSVKDIIYCHKSDDIEDDKVAMMKIQTWTSSHMQPGGQLFQGCI